MLASLGGCAMFTPATSSAPEPLTVTFPATWSQAAPTRTVGGGSAPEAMHLSAWWGRFNDPQLSTLVQNALEANTDVASAIAALQQSRALRDGKQAAMGATVSATAAAQRSTSGAGSSASASNRFAAGLEASWESDIFGGKRAAVDATQADADAALTTLGHVQVSVAAEVAVAYIQLRSYQAQLAIAQSNLHSQTETAQIVRWRAQAGLTTAVEVEQAATSVAQTAAQVPALQTSISKTLHSIAVLTGQTPGALNEVLATAQPVPVPEESLTLSLPAETLRQRPDVRAAEYKVVAARARVSQAEAARYPSFSLSGTLGLQSLTLGALTDGASLVSSLVASVAAPLMDGGAAQATVRAQEAVLAQSHASYRATVLAALQEVEDALAALQGDRQRLQQLQAAADAAQAAATLASQRYQSGLIDFQTVLTTQRTLLSTQDSVAAARADVSADLVRLYKALGGGWS
nr:efflux transporter outer membrane subunit [uncultured Rhodoferax sp.]